MGNQFHLVARTMRTIQSILVFAFIAIVHADHGGHQSHHGGRFRPVSHHQQASSHYRQPPAPAPQAPRGGSQDLVDIAIANPDFKMLVSLVSDLGLVDTIKNAEALTIFAPDDFAFGKIPSATLNSLSEEDKKTIVLRRGCQSACSSSYYRTCQDIRWRRNLLDQDC